MRKLVFILITCVLASCHYHDTLNPYLPPAESDYLPLEIGNSWDFTPIQPFESNNDGVIHREVIGITAINNRQYYLLRTSRSYNAYIDTAYYRIDENGFVFIYRKSRPNFEDKRLWLNAINGNTWTYPVDNNSTAKVTTIEGSLVIGSTSIANCKSFSYNVPNWADEENTITLAPGIGFVKEYSDAWGMGQVLKSAKIHGHVYHF